MSVGRVQPSTVLQALRLACDVARGTAESIEGSSQELSEEQALMAHGAYKVEGRLLKILAEYEEAAGHD